MSERLPSINDTPRRASGVPPPAPAPRGDDAWARTPPRAPSLLHSRRASPAASIYGPQMSSAALSSARSSGRPSRVAVDAPGAGPSAVRLAAGLLRDAVATGSAEDLTPRAVARLRPSPASPSSPSPGVGLSPGTHTEAELSRLFSARVASRRRLREMMEGAEDRAGDANENAPSTRARESPALSVRTKWGQQGLSHADRILSPLPHLASAERQGLGRPPAQLGTARDAGRSESHSWVEANAREAFTLYDEGSKGWMGSHETKCALTAVLGRKPSAVEMGALLKKCPRERVFWPEFWEHVQQRVAAADPMVRARRIFACYDEDGDGALDVREATAAFRQVAPDVPAHLASLMFAAADADGDGRVSMEEFVAFVAGKLEQRNAALGLAPPGSGMWTVGSTPLSSRWTSRPPSGGASQPLPDATRRTLHLG